MAYALRTSVSAALLDKEAGRIAKIMQGLTGYLASNFDASHPFLWRYSCKEAQNRNEATMVVLLRTLELGWCGYNEVVFPLKSAIHWQACLDNTLHY